VTARRPAIDHRRDGNFVAFGSFASNLVVGDANGNAADVFVRDQTTSTTTLASGATNGGSGPTAMASARFGRPANGSSGTAALSADGRYVAFHTTANNLGVTQHRHPRNVLGLPYRHLILRPRRRLRFRP
jgi:hypothetical protein